MSLNICPPKVRELLRYFGWSDLLEPEDEDPRDDDAEDVDESQGEAHEAEDESLEAE